MYAPHESKKEHSRHPAKTSSLKKNTDKQNIMVDRRAKTAIQRKVFSGVSNAENSPASTQETVQFYPGEDLIRGFKAKFRKKKQDAEDGAMGVYHGGGVSSRYTRLGAPTEEDHLNDIHDEEAEDRQRVVDHPVAERVRKYGLAPAKAVAKKAADVGGNIVAGPVGGQVAKMAVGKGLDEANERAKKAMTSGKAYKVLREESDEE